MDVRLPNGKIIRGVPDGTPKEVVMQKAIAAGLASESDFDIQRQEQPQTQSVDAGGEPSLSDKALGAAEVAGSVISGTIAEPLAGLAGIASIPFKGSNAGDVVESVRGALTYEPKTQQGQQYAQDLAQAPILSDISEAMQKGQKALGGAAFEATGSPVLAAAAETIPTALTFGAGKIASKVAEPAFRLAKGDSALPEKTQSAVDYAAKNDLILPTSDALPPTTAIGRHAQSAAEKIPFTGTGPMRAAQQEQRVAQIKKLSDEYGLPSDEEIVRSVSRKSDRIKKAAGDRYETIISQMGQTPIDLTQTMKVIDDSIAQYSRGGALKNEKVLASLQKVKDDLSSGEQDLQLIRQNRTLFREIIKGDDSALAESAKRINDKVYQAITNDMTNGVAKQLGPDTARKMREADAIYAEEFNTIKKTKLKSILEKGDIKPETATKMLFSNDKSEFKNLYSSLDMTGRQNARAAIVNRMFEKFDTTDSPEKFLSEANRLKPQIGEFFKGDERKQLDGLINYLDASRQATKASTITPTGIQNLQVTAPVAAVGDFQLTGGVGLATVGTLGGLARVYESKPVRSILVRMSSTPKNSPEFKRLSNELSGILAAYAQSEAEKDAGNN
jgi:hypothetical protein